MSKEKLTAHDVRKLRVCDFCGDLGHTQPSTDPRLLQIIKSHKSARPNPVENPAWFHTHNDLGYVLNHLTVTSHDGKLSPSSKEIAMTKLSQSIPWDPSRFIGFTDEQLELVRKGYFAALDEVYRLEKARENGERKGA